MEKVLPIIMILTKSKNIEIFVKNQTFGKNEIFIDFLHFSLFLQHPTA